MPPDLKRQWRRWHAAAVRIAPPRDAPLPPDPPQEAWRALQRVSRLLLEARRRGWRLAESRLRRRHALAVKRLRLALPDVAAAPLATDPSELAHDLAALREEFDEVQIDPRRALLSVVTDEIALEGVELGRFRVTLPWRRLDDASPAYEVEPLDPHPAGGTDTYHPHLAGSALCEGEGAAAIRAALADRRLLDFFVLVRQVLTTYNPESAYCELDSWDGVACVDCGHRVPYESDDHYRCERCGDDLCDGCYCDCGACDRVVCSGCRSECPGCDRAVCLSCWGEPPAKDRRCDECLESQPPTPTGGQHESEAKAPEPQAAPTPADAAADALRLGEAALPA